MLTGRHHSACPNAQEKAVKYKIKRGKKHSRCSILGKGLDGFEFRQRQLLLLFPPTLTPTATPQTTTGTSTPSRRQALPLGQRVHVKPAQMLGEVVLPGEAVPVLSCAVFFGAVEVLLLVVRLDVSGDVGLATEESRGLAVGAAAVFMRAGEFLFSEWPAWRIGLG